MRALGLAGVDLKDVAGQWLSEGDAIMRAQELNAAADAKRLNTAAPKSGVPKKVARSCEALWDRYIKSGKFTELAVSTQVDYANKVGPFLAAFGAYDVRAIDKPIMFGFAETLRVSRGKSMTLGVIAVARRLFSFAELIGWRPENSNPAFRLELARPAPRLRLGAPAEIAALVDAADRLPVRDRQGHPRGTMTLRSMGDAIVLALHSGQRQKDVLAMPDTIVDAERIKLSQFKTGVGIDIKMTPACAARMTAAKERARARDVVSLEGQPIIVHEGTGGAYNAHYFRSLFADVRAIATETCPSVADFQFLDLRDTAVTRLALARCTKWQICSITGHSYESIDRILKHYLVLSRDFADPAIDLLVAWMEREGIAI